MTEPLRQSDVQPETLAEVWGDVVDLGHLRLAVILGALISLGAFWGASELLERLGRDAQIDRAYAMFVGLAGCLAGGVLCAALFPPKRILIEATEDRERRGAAIAALFNVDEDRTPTLPAAAQAELDTLGFGEPAARRPTVSAAPSKPSAAH